MLENVKKYSDSSNDNEAADMGFKKTIFEDESSDSSFWVGNFVKQNLKLLKEDISNWASFEKKYNWILYINKIKTK